MTHPFPVKSSPCHKPQTNSAQIMIFSSRENWVHYTTIVPHWKWCRNAATEFISMHAAGIIFNRIASTHRLMSLSQWENVSDSRVPAPHCNLGKIDCVIWLFDGTCTDYLSFVSVSLLAEHWLEAFFCATYVLCSGKEGGSCLCLKSIENIAQRLSVITGRGTSVCSFIQNFTHRKYLRLASIHCKATLQSDESPWIHR